VRRQKRSDKGGCGRRAERSVPPVPRVAVPAAQCAWRLMTPATKAIAKAGALAEGALQLRQIARAVAASTFELSHRRGLAQRATAIVRAAAARAASCAAVARRQRSKTGRACARVTRPAAGPSAGYGLSPRACGTPLPTPLCPRSSCHTRCRACGCERVVALSRPRSGTLDRHNGRWSACAACRSGVDTPRHSAKLGRRVAIVKSERRAKNELLKLYNLAAR
jgi:hypothetical protein